jgi:uncharacterized Tic20 family protein
MKSVTTSDERVWAALAHGAILLFGFGMIASLVIWITQRKKSAYVAFQSLQALLYQTLQSVVFMLVGLVIAIFDLILATILALFIRNTGAGNHITPFLLVEIIPVIFLFVLIGLYYLVGLVAAGLCLAGRQARYPWLGGWLAGYLNRDPERLEERQDRVVACACHLGAFISIWGIALPVIAWLSEKGRSAMLRFQGLQAMIYQLIGLAFTILLVLVAFAMQLFSTLVFFLAIPAPNPSNIHWVFILTMLPLLALFCIFALTLLLGPLYQTFALIAAWQVSHDRDYRYPLLGKWLASRLKT